MFSADGLIILFFVDTSGDILMLKIQVFLLTIKQKKKPNGNK